LFEQSNVAIKTAIYNHKNKMLFRRKGKMETKRIKVIKKVGKIGKMHPGQSVYNLRTTTHVLIDTRIDKTEAGCHFVLVSLLCSA